MFAKEAEMTGPAVDWLSANGMIVKAEFVTPWGVCDLVGLRFNPDRVAHRVRLRQVRTLGSITRAALLLEIPDVETGESTTLDQLAHQRIDSIPRNIVSGETERLIADRFVSRSADGRLQKLNGWMPLHDRMMAIELKLSKVEEAMRQALSNLGFAEESYVGLPSEIARRVASKSSKWSKYIEAGIGILSVTHSSCEVVVAAKRSRRWIDGILELYCVEKFWRNRIRGS